MTTFYTSGLGRPGRVRFGSDKRAFTFIEIMMVVLIIGMLAAVVMPVMTGKAEKARIAKAKADMTSFATALGMYEMTLGEFPTTDQGLDALVRRPADIPPDKWEKTIPSIPKDPWDSPYVYRFPGEDGRDYELFSLGHDRKEGSEDDVLLQPRDEGSGM